MELLIGAAVYALLFGKLWSVARTDHEYAKQGLTPPRMQAKYGKDAVAKVARYGFLDYLRDAWRDYWPRRTDALIAARDAKAANPSEPVRWADRWAAAERAVVTGTRRLVDPVPTKTEREAARQPEEPSAAVEPAPPAHPQADEQPVPSKEEPAMTAPAAGGPTGEAVNYETTVAELEKMIADARSQIDSAGAALKSIGETKAAVDNMQQTYQATAQAAQSKLDHEAALHLDATTLGHAGTTVDSLPPNAVDQLYDELEAMETQVSDRLHQSETAHASLEAELRHVVETYGDAHATVAGNLGGDSRFLDSGGGMDGGGRSGGGAASPSGGGIVATGNEDINFVGVVGKSGNGSPSPRKPSPSGASAGGVTLHGVNHFGKGAIHHTGPTGDHAVYNEAGA